MIRLGEFFNPEQKKLRLGQELSTKKRRLGQSLLTALKETNIDTERCLALIADGANTNEKDEKGQPALHTAVYRTRDARIVQALIDAGADLDAKDKDGWTALHQASTFDGRPAALKALIKAGANIDAVNDHNWTPLMFAAEGSFCNCAQLLLDADADLDIKNNSGQTALDIARGEEGTPSVAKILEEAPLKRAAAKKAAQQENLQKIDTLAHTGSENTLESAPLPIIRKRPMLAQVKA